MPFNFEPGRILRVLEAYVANPRPALVGIGAYLLSRSQRSFREQSFGGSAWEPRGVPNVLGIVAFLREKGPVPPLRYLDPRPALVDTGMLKMSLAMRVTGRMEVQVGSTLPYASLMNFGGESSQTVTDIVRQRLNSLLGRKPWSDYDSALRPLLDPAFPVVKKKVPARTFVGLDLAAQKKIVDIVSETALGKFRVTYL